MLHPPYSGGCSIYRRLADRFLTVFVLFFIILLIVSLENY